MSTVELDRAPRTLASLATLASPDAVAELEAIRELLDGCNDPQRLEAIAGAIPRQVSQLAPETCLALRRLALALCDHHVRLPEDLDRLEPRLQIAWLQVRLSSLEDQPGEREASPLDEIGDIELLRAMMAERDWSPLDVAAPSALLLRMARAADARLREWVPGLLQPGIQRLALGGEQAFECLHTVVGDRDRLAARGSRAADLRCAGEIGPLGEIELLRMVEQELLIPFGPGSWRPWATLASNCKVKLRTAARDALLAWGPDLLPALRRAAAKARPDRRRAIAELIEQLEQGE